VAYVIAGLTAAAVLVAEQRFRLRLWFTFPALPWWVFRAVVETALALALVAALRRVPASIVSLNGIVLGVVAGLAAPRALGRTQFSVLDRNVNPINLAYQRATVPLDEAIDESSAECQRRYVGQVILPAAERGELNAETIAEAFRQHLSGRHLMSSAERAARLAFINEIMEDSAPDHQKVGALVLKAWEIGAYRALQDELRPLPRRRYGAPAWLRGMLRWLGFKPTQ
jgi:hypothetical protein